MRNKSFKLINMTKILKQLDIHLYANKFKIVF